MFLCSFKWQFCPGDVHCLFSGWPLTGCANCGILEALRHHIGIVEYYFSKQEILLWFPEVGSSSYRCRFLFLTLVKNLSALSQAVDPGQFVSLIAACWGVSDRWGVVWLVLEGKRRSRTLHSLSYNFSWTEIISVSSIVPDKNPSRIIDFHINFCLWCLHGNARIYLCNEKHKDDTDQRLISSLLRLVHTFFSMTCMQNTSIELTFTSYYGKNHPKVNYN